MVFNDVEVFVLSFDDHSKDFKTHEGDGRAILSDFLVYLVNDGLCYLFKVDHAELFKLGILLGAIFHRGDGVNEYVEFILAGFNKVRIPFKECELFFQEHGVGDCVDFGSVFFN